MSWRDISDELGTQTQDLGWYRKDRRLRCRRRDVQWRLSWKVKRKSWKDKTMKKKGWGCCDCSSLIGSKSKKTGQIGQLGTTRLLR